MSTRFVVRELSKDLRYNTLIMIYLIDITDLNEILERLSNSHFYSSKWIEFGLKLGLYEPTLDEIRADCGTSVSSCLRECLTRWLKKQDDVANRGGVNYNSLADALRNIGEIAVAENISKC